MNNKYYTVFVATPALHNQFFVFSEGTLFGKNNPFKMKKNKKIKIIILVSLIFYICNNDLYLLFLEIFLSKFSCIEKFKIFY